KRIINIARAYRSTRSEVNQRRMAIWRKEDKKLSRKARGNTSNRSGCREKATAGISSLKARNSHLYAAERTTR
ncbi:hypothetical protein TSAR_009158, partial [Trichomalopsis sarcophagae]